MPSEWIKHVQLYREKHPEKSYKQCLKDAKESYNKQEGKGNSSSISSSSRSKGKKQVDWRSLGKEVKSQQQKEKELRRIRKKASKAEDKDFDWRTAREITDLEEKEKRIKRGKGFSDDLLKTLVVSSIGGIGATAVGGVVGSKIAKKRGKSKALGATVGGLAPHVLGTLGLMGYEAFKKSRQ